VKESAGCFKRCAAGLTDPLYEQTSGSVRLTLSGEPLHRELDARLPDEARAIVSALREAERLSTGELAEVAGVARPTMIRYLQRLKDADIVDWVGKTARDPRAYWRLRG
jgi:ATP-dependent DNA helicase RecG